MGPVHSVPGLRASPQEGDLHDQQHRVAELPAPQIIKNRGHFPNDAAAIKLLWLAICNIEDKRARERAKEAGRPKGQARNAPGKLVDGSLAQGWKAALGELSLVYADRIRPYL